VLGVPVGFEARIELAVDHKHTPARLFLDWPEIGQRAYIGAIFQRTIPKPRSII
jgi:hypothetical protein